MSKTFKVTAIVAVTAMILAAPVFAPSIYGQVLSPLSPTAVATAGVFAGEGDNAMDVLGFSDVEFDKGIVFAGIGGSLPSLGFATKFSDSLYFGAWYSGNIFRENSSEEQEVVTDYNLLTKTSTGSTTTTSYYDQYSNINNNIAFLFGIGGNMGIKVGFFENLNVWKNPNGNYGSYDVTITETAGGVTKTYSGEIVEFSQISGSVVPYLEWGMNIGSISPKITVGFDIHQDNRVFNTKGQYQTVNGEVIGSEVISYTGNVKDYLSPDVTVGVDIGISDEATIGISYNLNMRLYDNSYDVLGQSGSVSGIVNWYSGRSAITETLAGKTTDTELTVNTSEITSMAHAVTPSFSLEKELTDGLKLGFYFELPVSFGTTTDESLSSYKRTIKNEYTFNTFNNNTEVRESLNQGNKIEVSTFSLETNLSIGASYVVIPNRLTLNAGVGLSPVSFSNVTTTVSNGNVNTQQQKTSYYDADGNLVRETSDIQQNSGNYNSGQTTDSTRDSVTVETEWNGFGAGAAGGFTFYFTDSLSADFAAFYSTNGGGGVQALFSLKY